jgi:murein DD-endopeptidase MepM/ murein hydrolase activator NlpD
MLTDPMQDQPRDARVWAWYRRPVVFLGLGMVVGALLGAAFVHFLKGGPEPAVVEAPPHPAAPPPTILTLRKGHTFQDALHGHGMDRNLAERILHAFRSHLDFRRLKPGDGVEVHYDPAGGVSRVVYRQSPVDIVEAWKDGDAWAAGKRDVQVDRRVASVAGALEGSLFESIEGLGEHAQLVLDFAEVFAWDFDFAQDSQPGDRFRMLVEKIYTGDQFVRYGRILVAEYEEAGGKVHTGIYFTDGSESGYYTPAGESLRRAFLKSPLEFSRITSRFSHARRHPILGGVRPHLAVDYAAPRGTPVFAVADGVIESAGWLGGNGNTVTLRHRSNFKTMYNHLAAFGKGIRAGTHVKQRQVIGYVGSTGLSTGPHLDYRVMKDGRFVNPLKQIFLPGKPISPGARPAFVEARDTLVRQLHEAVAAMSGTDPNS